MMNGVTTKLRIQLGDVSLDVEGDAALVREVYQDFREQFRAQIVQQQRSEPRNAIQDVDGAPSSYEEEAAPTARARSKPSGRKRRKSNGAAGEGKASSYAPSVLKNLETPGLQEYLSQWQPKSHTEKVLIFAAYLKEQGHDPCTADQIFTCYFKLKLPRPKAFVQALRDAHGKKHSFIEYQSPEDVTVTTIGEDHLWHHMAKAETVA